jgi:anti-sigma regulatory factor (Ser/Thr protein kinase)
MGSTAVEIDPRLISFGLPSVPESVRMARFHVRAALGFHELDEYANDAAIVASELVTNAIQHVPSGGAETVVVTLVRTWNPEAVTVVVWDSSPEGPVLRETSADSGRGRGLQIVEALSVFWGWHPEDGGKVVLAILAREQGA